MTASTLEGDGAEDAAVVRALLDSQSPQWGGLPLQPMTTSGTEHATYRLGDDHVVRVPRDVDAEQGLRKEVAWLRRVADHLPVDVPVVEHVGEHAPVTGGAWAVNRWVPGEDVAERVLAGDIPLGWADSIAAILMALRAFDLNAVAQSQWPRGSRGGHLRERVAVLNGQVDPLAGPLDPTPVAGVVEAALRSGTPDARAVLLHADLIPGNLVAQGNRLTGLLDFGTLTTGFAAWDLTPAWWVLDAPARQRLRELLDVDDTSWAWGRAFAAAQGLLADWYYRPRRHALAPLGARAVSEALAQ